MLANTVAQETRISAPGHQPAYLLILHDPAAKLLIIISSYLQPVCQRAEALHRRLVDAGGKHSAAVMPQQDKDNDERQKSRKKDRGI